MLIEIDYTSDEAIYMQLHDQIIIAIANNLIRQGESLPSVRSLADSVGINMHTVNKAYTILKQEGYIRVDRRRGAVICVDEAKEASLSEITEDLKVILAKASCRGISRQELQRIIDGIYTEYGGNN
ncbi:MAG: GntR family transcriptional regulator [Lachnospiraceae bacterium]|nr:GntR family transcriptional regulator [Lachnospiraceae bacterium]